MLATPSVSDSATSAVDRELSETGAQITRRNLNVQPTIKVPAGYKFTVRVNRDILFDAPYEPESADPEVVTPKKNSRSAPVCERLDASGFTKEDEAVHPPDL